MLAALGLVAMAKQLAFDALEFLKEEISAKNTADVRINATKQLNLIAYALGEEKTADALVPFLNKEIGCNGESNAPKSNDPNNKEGALTNENDDEFLYCMAKQYGELRKFIHQDRLETLMKPLVHLAQQEETVIRDEAISSLCTIVEMKPKELRGQLMGHLKEMTKQSGGSQFTTRVSACSLFPAVYKHHKAEYDNNSAENKEIRKELCKSYHTICNDDTPMVRRAAANRMKDLVMELDQEELCDPASLILDAYQNMAKEPTQDVIRVAVVNTSIELAKLYKKFGNEQMMSDQTLPVFCTMMGDKSWRVRLTVVKSFELVMQLFGANAAVPQRIIDERAAEEKRPCHTLLDFLKMLLQDQEAEVRKESIKTINKCISDGSLKADDVVQLLEYMCNPAESSQQVRAAYADALGPVVQALGADKTREKLLASKSANSTVIGIPELFKDDIHDVRLNAVNHAGLICEILGDMHSAPIHPMVQGLIMDNHWRIRQAVVFQVPKLAKKLGQDQYTKQFEPVLLSSLKDSVYSVRKAAIDMLREVANIFGAQWTAEKLVPKILEGYKDNAGYANRVTTLQALPQVWDVVTGPQGSVDEEMVKSIIDLLVKALKDGVPNVRFCACKMIVQLCEKSGIREADKKSLAEKARAPLKALEQDSDLDCQFYSAQAVKKLDALTI